MASRYVNTNYNHSYATTMTPFQLLSQYVCETVPSLLRVFLKNNKRVGNKIVAP